MRYDHQNLTDGRLPLWRHGRAWWGPASWEWSAFGKESRSFGLAFGLTSFSVRSPFFALYVRFGDRDGWAREFEIRIMDGCIWLDHPWVRQMEWRSDDPWWKKSITLHVGDWLLGRSRCEVTEGPKSTVYVPLPEGSYRATATPETFIWRRRFYVPIRRRDSVRLQIEGGIPYSGKGENSWDCGDDGLWGIGGATLEEAIGNAVAAVLKSRRRHGHDSKGTGRRPAIVLNDPPRSVA